MSVDHPFRIISKEDSSRRLPFLFGEDIEELEINLSDSTNGQRIKVPGRGSSCDHIDVVDVSSSTKASHPEAIEWMCPVCGSEYMHTDEIEVDALIFDIIEQVKAEDAEGSIRAVNLKKDGSWSHVSANPEERLPMKRKKRARLTLAQINAIAGINQGGNHLVDLESFDDEAEGPPAKHQVQSRSDEVVDLDSD